MSATGGRVGIIGAGTMGAGIAQVAAGAGWTVDLKDMDASTVEHAIAGIAARFDRLVEKGRLDSAQRDEAVGRLHVAESAKSLEQCELIIEVVVENLDVKAKVLGELLSVLSVDAIIATNTSSLSVTALGERIGEAHRTVGMHFFNPAPLMRLVEVVAGESTSPQVVERTAEIARSWGKHVAKAADVPGFIVNHVARPYYLESFRILEDGFASPEEIDAAMKEIGGFRMGPFELTDLIGHDVNTATTRQVWDGVGRPNLLAPSSLQESLVEAGHLGRKSGQGVYRYSDDAAPTVALAIDREDFRMSDELRDAVRAIASRVGGESAKALDDTACYIVARVLHAIFRQAQAAFERGVATAADIDTAMKFGVNWPKGPFEWMEEIGRAELDRLQRALAG